MTRYNRQIEMQKKKSPTELINSKIAKFWEQYGDVPESILINHYTLQEFCRENLHPIVANVHGSMPARTIRVYESDFGRVTFVPSSVIPENEILIIPHVRRS